MQLALIRSLTLTILRSKRGLTHGFLSLATVSAGAAQCGTTEIPPQPGFEESVAWAISSDGSTVVGAGLSSGARAFRWTEATGLQPLLAFGAGEALGVSADGSIVVGYGGLQSGPMKPVAWDAQGALIDLLAGSGISGVGEAHDVSADGSVVVGYWTTGLAGSAFRWTAATGAVDLATPGATFSEAHAVSDDGTVVVGSMRIGGQDRAFRWTAAGGAVDIGPASGGRSEAFGISGDGETVVGWADLGSGVSQAFRWTAATGMVGVGAGFGGNSVLRATTARGERAVGRTSAPKVAAWSEATGRVDLETWIPAGFDALDISENGVVVGYRISDPFSGSSRAFVWRSSTVGTTYCDAATANETGCIGRLDVNGSASVAANALRLDASSLPANVFGLFLAARATGSTPAAGGGAGTLCLGGPIGRFNGPGQVQSTGSGGTMGLALDLGALPSPNALVPAQPGETWTFQAWHRSASGTSSNFTDAVAVTLE